MLLPAIGHVRVTSFGLAAGGGRGRRSAGELAAAESSSAADVEAGAVLDADAEAATQGEQRRDVCGMGGGRCFPAGAAGGGVTGPGAVAAGEP